MRILRVVAILVSLNAVAWAAPAVNEPSATGLWEQVDEKTGTAESWFSIAEKDGIYTGTIVKMFQKPGDPPPEVVALHEVRGGGEKCPRVGPRPDQRDETERPKVRGRHDHGPA